VGVQVLNVQSAGDSRYDAGRADALSAVPKTTGYWWPRDAGTDLPASPMPKVRTAIGEGIELEQQLSAGITAAA